MADYPNRIAAQRRRRKLRVRKKVHGTAERPRLVINRSLKHIAASLVNDEEGRTLMGVSDIVLQGGDQFPVPDDVMKTIKKNHKVQLAYRVGMALAEKAKDKGYDRVVFDRNGLRYHGRVKAVADGARKGGLKF
ncbi:50S ribosomal protein L18 [bacterium]|nr:50S ribosomal protein L18 [bacterium]